MLHFDPIALVSSFPPELGVFFLSMLPVTELRAAIPIGLQIYHLPVITTWILAVVGNLVPTAIILYVMPRIHEIVMRYKIFGTMVTKQLEKAEKKFHKHYTTYGKIALVLFVGIPLPLTGAWTGSLAAFVFNIRFKEAFPLIALGVALSATIVTVITRIAAHVLV